MWWSMGASLSKDRFKTDDQLETVLLDEKSVLNSRPRSAVARDTDGETPLTPNHLLSQHGCRFPTNTYY